MTILFLILASIVYAWVSLAPWVPTSNKDLNRLHKIAKLKKGETFLEMGCGNGRVCTYIARKNPSAKVIGIELALPFYLFTKIRVMIFGPKNLKIIFGNALKYDISNIDVIYVFGLMETVNKEIKKKIEKELPKNSRFISYIFTIKEWSGQKETHKETDKTSGIHVYMK
ncbi:hypothetical protein COU74_02880 [Candidatus Peregrinibacteria bacterium CG10_big_fil_rev_8_21_14_0_10_36_19]|nr:MAG: hypothetical protein COU74_02880 [Candidatus Peregrinibacteria bacterium CG10_big_fil_rev_8_21_14_0_10_36_19]